MYFRRHNRPAARAPSTADALPAGGCSPRYAIYYAPEPASGWWRFGCAWLGRDAITGAGMEPPEVQGVAAEEIARWTEGARRYGWHATLKAPFRLAPPYTAADLYEEAAQAAAALPRAEFGALELAEIGSFVALRLASARPAVDAVACECTRRFDHLRAPATAQELAKRLDAGLTPRQQQILRRWGHPYSMEEFRFHLTLTDPLGAAERSRVIAALAPHVAGLQASPLRLDALCIFRQPSPGASFALLRRYGFDGNVEIYGNE